jgi:RNA polymerase-binding protein DksA
MKASELDGYRKVLLERKEHLSSALENLHTENPGVDDEEGSELNSLAEAHLAEAGSLTLDREIDYTLEEAAQERLKEIEVALERIERESFGLCTSCGAEIASERLEALPWASLCIDCKRREERG